MRRHLWPVAAILAAVFLSYSNSIRNGFVWDDRLLIEHNAFVQDPANLRHLLNPRFYTGAHAVFSGNRPVLLASLLIDRALWVDNPAGYHLTNILLHAANSVRVYSLAWALAPAGPVALFAGLLFGLHPIQTEAVNAISFRADLLAAFFCFSALWAYRRSRLAASTILFAMGLLSKEMAVTLPGLVLLSELYIPSAPNRRRLIRALAVYGVVLAAYAGFWTPRFRYAQLPSSPLREGIDRAASRLPTAPGPGTLTLPVRNRTEVFASSPPAWTEIYEDRRVWFWTMTKAFAGYVRLMIYPAVLVADRPPEVVRTWREPGVLASAALLAALLLAAYLLRRRFPLPGFGFAWCALALIPVSGFLPLYNPVAERYLYFVCAGFAWALAWGLGLFWAIPRGRVAAGACAALILLSYCVRTHVRNWDWKSEETLFFAAAPQDLLSPRAHYIRSTVLRESGLLEAAVGELEKALLLNPRMAEAVLSLAMTKAELGHGAKAALSYEKALALDPQNPVYLFSYALFLGRTPQTARAAALYRQALELEPGYLQAWVNLAALYRDQNDFKKAESCYEKALALAGSDPLPFYSYASLLERAGKRKRAAALFQAALVRDPDYEPARARLAELKKSDGVIDEKVRNNKRNNHFTSSDESKFKISK